MPLTPFHMGPGLLLKATLQRRFSLIVFGWSQVVIDLQPLLVLITGSGTLHGLSHTYLSATLIALFCGLTGGRIASWILSLVNRELTPGQQAVLGTNAQATMGVSLFSAALGSFSHVLLDSLMHSDMQPFYPVSDANQLLYSVSRHNIYSWCVYAGLLGMALYTIVRVIHTKRSDPPAP
jgi:hypothetical protein